LERHVLDNVTEGYYPSSYNKVIYISAVHIAYLDINFNFNQPTKYDLRPVPYSKNNEFLYSHSVYLHVLRLYITAEG
jgi:hypothetical protein